jgi:acetate kinase
MPSILAINTGSTSIKYKQYQIATKQDDDLILLQEGLFENVVDFSATIRNLLRKLGSLHDLQAIVHRVVHGGRNLSGTVEINERVLNEIQKVSHLAPLHNPANLAGIEAFGHYLPELKQVAVFDTAFYSSLPEVARLYPIPQSLAAEHDFYRYGFHGISHEYAMEMGAKELKLDYRKINLITCHLGGGWSITAIKKGQAIDTSMGFTPLEGLMMLTRSGDIDPGIIFEIYKICLAEQPEISLEKPLKALDRLKLILNQESGLKGLAGIGDYKELLRQMSLGHVQAKQAFELAVYRLSKYISAYYGVLEGQVDAVIFTGKIGAGNPITRVKALKNLKFFEKTPILAIEPNEELMLAKKALMLLNK